MSKKDSVTKSKRINSIVHRLTWHNIGSSIGQCFAMDLFMFFILVIGWAAMIEYMSFGFFLDDSKRKFVSFKNIKEIKYVIIKDGKEVLSADFYGPLLVIGSVIVAFFMAIISPFCKSVLCRWDKYTDLKCSKLYTHCRAKNVGSRAGPLFRSIIVGFRSKNAA